MGDMAEELVDMCLNGEIDDGIGRPTGRPFARPLCQYCRNPAEQVTGDVIYPHRPDLKKLLFYRCEPCDAYVGCHEKTGLPFGTLANAELRRARNEAHMFFDKLWRFSWSGMTRNQAYKWLRGAMGCSKADCHIAKFNVKQCKKAAELSRLKLAELAANK